MDSQKPDADKKKEQSENSSSGSASSLSQKRKLQSASDKTSQRNEREIAITVFSVALRNPAQLRFPQMQALSQLILEFYEGAIPLAHQRYHSFRNRDEKREISPRRFLNYYSSRGSFQHNMSETSYPDRYNDKSPNFQFKSRDRSPEKQIQPLMKFTPHNVKERIRQSLLKQIPLDGEPLNTKLISEPKFRTTSHQKWLSNVSLAPDGRQETWDVIKNYDPHNADPYLNGLKPLGDKIQSRQRSPQKEISKTLFTPIGQTKAWRSESSNTKSIRSYKALTSKMSILNLSSVKESVKELRIDDYQNRSTSVPSFIKRQSMPMRKNALGAQVITSTQEYQLPVLEPSTEKNKVKPVKLSLQLEQDNAITLSNSESLTQRDFSSLLDSRKVYLQSAQQIMKPPPKIQSQSNRAVPRALLGRTSEAFLRRIKPSFERIEEMPQGLHMFHASPDFEQ